MNKVILTGRLAKENEIKEFKTSNGLTKIIQNTLAVDDGKDKDGNRFTQWLDFKAFNGVADILYKFTQKGSKIAIEGKLRIDKWEDNGQQYSRSFIYVENIELLDSKEKKEEPKTATEIIVDVNKKDDYKEKTANVIDEDLIF